MYEENNNDNNNINFEEEEEIELCFLQEEEEDIDIDMSVNNNNNFDGCDGPEGDNFDLDGLEGDGFNEGADGDNNDNDAQKEVVEFAKVKRKPGRPPGSVNVRKGKDVYEMRGEKRPRDKVNTIQRGMKPFAEMWDSTVPEYHKIREVERHIGTEETKVNEALFYAREEVFGIDNFNFDIEYQIKKRYENRAAVSQYEGQNGEKYTQAFDSSYRENNVKWGHVNGMFADLKYDDIGLRPSITRAISMNLYNRFKDNDGNDDDSIKTKVSSIMALTNILSIQSKLPEAEFYRQVSKYLGSALGMDEGEVHNNLFRAKVQQTVFDTPAPNTDIDKEKFITTPNDNNDNDHMDLSELPSTHTIIESIGSEQRSNKRRKYGKFIKKIGITKVLDLTKLDENKKDHKQKKQKKIISL